MPRLQILQYLQPIGAPGWWMLQLDALEQTMSDYYEHAASAPNAILEGRDMLLAWLKENPGEHHMVHVCQTLGWRGNKVGLIARKYPRYFQAWEEYERPNRKSFICLHPHLR